MAHVVNNLYYGVQDLTMTTPDLEVCGFVPHDHILDGSLPELFLSLGFVLSFPLLLPYLDLSYHSRTFVNCQGRTYYDWESNDVKRGFRPPPRR